MSSCVAAILVLLAGRAFLFRVAKKSEACVALALIDSYVGPSADCVRPLLSKPAILGVARDSRNRQGFQSSARWHIRRLQTGHHF